MINASARLPRHSSIAMWTLVAARFEFAGNRIKCRTIDNLASDHGDFDAIKIEAVDAELDVLPEGMVTIER